MDLVRQYIAGLNQAIKAGSDVRAPIDGLMQALIKIEVDEEQKDLFVTYLNPSTPFDKTAHIPLRSRFKVEFSDYPNELRDAGWK